MFLNLEVCIIQKLIKSVIKSTDALVKKYKFTRWMEPLVKEADLFFFSSTERSQGYCKVRDCTDYKRMMIMVVFALLPTLLWGIYNCGFQINRMYSEVLHYNDGIRLFILQSLSLQIDPDSVLSCFVMGCLYFVPMYVVGLVVGGLIEVAFSVVRKTSINEGFLVTSLIFPMILPCGIELWKVALGIAFGVIFGKEVFGGTGKNIFNPALVGRIFLFFAFPASMSGDVWLDGTSGATYLSGPTNLDDINFLSLFLGDKFGCIGETSSCMCLLGGVFLLFTKIASWRIVVSSLLSLGIFSYIFELLSFTQIPWYHQFVVGGALFGIFFMATDPVTSSYTKIGKYIYGTIIGTLIVVIRIFNPGFPEGVMFSILIGNALAPLIDQIILSMMIRRRDKKLRSYT